MRGRVKDLLVVRDDRSREPVLRIPSGRHFLVVVDAVPSSAPPGGEDARARTRR